MANIQEIVGKQFPEVTFAQGETLELTVPDARWHAVATLLRNELGFDNLRALIGMDWGEELGVVYYIVNSRTYEMIRVKVSTADREHPFLHSITARYAVAGTLDFLEYDGSKFTIYDWKRSNKVVDASGNICMNSYKRTGLAPLENLPDTVYVHYALQISIYRFILAEHYGIDVAEAYLGVFHPDLPVPFRVGLPYLRNEVIKLLSPRQK